MDRHELRAALLKILATPKQTTNYSLAVMFARASAKGDVPVNKHTAYNWLQGKSDVPQYVTVIINNRRST